jgi:hypothetical protein
MHKAKKAACLAKPLDEVTYDQVIVRVSGIYRGKGCADSRIRIIELDGDCLSITLTEEY